MGLNNLKRVLDKTYNGQKNPKLARKESGKTTKIVLPLVRYMPTAQKCKKLLTTRKTAEGAYVQLRAKW